ncbi:hypothetical protein H9P43_000705 [Blastocladiella emersonii ATCC 22665]|nr:hypothetical protein H9P43_000705 [Blastocladiella emersonii ATCC 22665]
MPQPSPPPRLLPRPRRRTLAAAVASIAVCATCLALSAAAPAAAASNVSLPATAAPTSSPPPWSALYRRRPDTGVAASASNSSARHSDSANSKWPCFGPCLNNSTCNELTGWCTCVDQPRSTDPSKPKRYTPPSRNCGLFGLEAMNQTWLAATKWIVGVLFSSLAFLPAHQVALHVYRQPTGAPYSKTLLLRIALYAAIAVLAIARAVHYNVDTYGLAGVLPRLVNRFFFTGVSTAVFSIFTGTLVLWLGDITSSHHLSHHAAVPPTPTSPTSLGACSPHSAYRSHAQRIFARSCLVFAMANAVMWGLEITFMITVESQPDHIRLATLILTGAYLAISAGLALGVAAISRHFDACHAPTPQLQDILVVPYKPGETSILDVVPLPNRLIRVATCTILASCSLRILLVWPNLLRVRNPDIWLANQLGLRLLEYTTFAVLTYALVVIPCKEKVPVPSATTLDRNGGPPTSSSGVCALFADGHGQSGFASMPSSPTVASPRRDTHQLQPVPPSTAAASTHAKPALPGSVDSFEHLYWLTHGVHVGSLERTRDRERDCQPARPAPAVPNPRSPVVPDFAHAFDRPGATRVVSGGNVVPPTAALGVYTSARPAAAEEPRRSRLQVAPPGGELQGWQPRHASTTAAAGSGGRSRSRSTSRQRSLPRRPNSANTEDDEPWRAKGPIAW